MKIVPNDRRAWTLLGVLIALVIALLLIVALLPRVKAQVMLPHRHSWGGGTVLLCGITNSCDGSTYCEVLAKDGRIWLDRNLGAVQVAANFNDGYSYGDYYQWGRLCDGHQLTNSAVTSTKSATDNPGTSDFITGSAPNYDWRVPHNPNLWQGVSGVNLPCPTGYRVPTSNEWKVLIAAEGIIDAATAYSSTLKLPTAGYRHWSTAAYNSQGETLLYWSMSTNSSGYESEALTTATNAASAVVDPWVRAYGVPIRCIKD